jgi:hypothetical protein
MSMLIRGLAPTTDAGDQLHASGDTWYELWALTTALAPDLFGPAFRKQGFRNDGARVPAPSVRIVLQRIANTPRGKLLTKHPELRSADIDYYVTFLESCGGFRID